MRAIASYIEYFDDSAAAHPHWEDAFEDAFGIRPAAFYAEFAASKPQMERAVTGATLAEADAQDRDGLLGHRRHCIPGLNLIGWLEEPTPVGELFDAIPRAEALFVWDAPEQTWRYASRNVRAPYGGLDLLKPGMGVWLRLGGTGAARWERLVVPGDPKTVSLTGYADLHQGGGIRRVGRFVAKSLDAARRRSLCGSSAGTAPGNSGTDRMCPRRLDSSEAVNDLRAGDGFWIATARSGLWRQALRPAGGPTQD